MRLAILGASGHGKVIADAALLTGWDEVLFFDDAWPRTMAVGRWHVVGDTAVLLGELAKHDGVMVGIGDCRIRQQKHLVLREAGARLVTVVHPRSWVSSFARIGAGTVLMAGAVVNVDTTIGEACILNTGATVDHDCVLADGAHVAPGAHLSGGVTVGERSWIGVGASVRQGIRIGSDVVVGAGAVVVKHIENGLTVVGMPASPLETFKNE